MNDAVARGAGAWLHLAETGAFFLNFEFKQMTTAGKDTNLQVKFTFRGMGLHFLCFSVTKWSQLRQFESKDMKSKDVSNYAFLMGTQNPRWIFLQIVCGFAQSSKFQIYTKGTTKNISSTTWHQFLLLSGGENPDQMRWKCPGIGRLRVKSARENAARVPGEAKSWLSSRRAFCVKWSGLHRMRLIQSGYMGLIQCRTVSVRLTPHC